MGRYLDIVRQAEAKRFNTSVEDAVIAAVSHLSEEDAVRRIIGAIVARFDGDSLLAIASELIDVYRHTPPSGGAFP
jgi:hypothetical protein